MLGVACTVTAPVPLIGGGGGVRGENWPQAAAHVKATAHKRRAAIAPFDGDACSENNFILFRVTMARIKSIKIIVARMVSGRLGEGAKGAPGGLR